MIFIDIFSIWKVGRFLSEKTFSCENIHRSCSNFLSYYYGNSSRFSLIHIVMMRRLYLYFPIFIPCMCQIQWNSYLELLKLNREECYFYYKILLFCGDDIQELKQLIYSNYYLRIKKTDN